MSFRTKEQATRSTWTALAQRLAALAEDANSQDIAVPQDSVFVPTNRPVPAEVLAAAARIPGQPFLLWDGVHLRDHVAAVQRILSSHGIGLSVGLKACANDTVLRLLAQLGLHADAQSLGECALAAKAGFRTVTATGPAFTPAAMRQVIESGVLFDAQSVTQLRQLSDERVRGPVGVRIRIRLPDRLVHPAMRGFASRFGVPLERGAVEQLLTGAVQLNRVRVHTGEALSVDITRTLEYRARLGCVLREAIGTIGQINLGGGFISLSRDQDALAEAFSRVGRILDDDAELTGSRATAWVEPGSALLLDSAYLVTQVLDTDRGARTVTVDASPWNVAPWTYPAVYVVGDEPWPFTGDIYGPALYENDRFRRTGSYSEKTRMPRIGDRLLITSFGSYTLVHGRTFGQLPLPRQYLLDQGSWQEII